MREEVTVSTRFTTDTRVTGFSSSINDFGLSRESGIGKAQEMVSKLKEEVQVLQEEILRTRRALDQRNLLLRCDAPQEIELRNHF
jgi:hypothetical protein